MFTASKPCFAIMKKFSDSENFSFKLISDIACVSTASTPTSIRVIKNQAAAFMYTIKSGSFVMMAHNALYILSHWFYWSRIKCKNDRIWHMTTTWKPHLENCLDIAGSLVYDGKQNKHVNA